ncbi:MAG: type II toxin-antitoxin system HicA family toxin [Bacteroidetes bacterium CHB5]|nr:type II toxin-antitoxin system HicA family toxin [Bacteroidetes bacterium CHB5]
MSRFEKALSRLKSKPKDFTWRELVSIMIHFGYSEIKGVGSRRKFHHPQTKAVVSLHEPHPRPVLKAYAIEIIIEHLKEQELI